MLEALPPDTFGVLVLGAVTFAMLSSTLRDRKRQSPGLIPKNTFIAKLLIHVLPPAPLPCYSLEIATNNPSVMKNCRCFKNLGKVRLKTFSHVLQPLQSAKIAVYRSQSLIRNCLPPGPYSRTVPRALRWS